MSLVKTLIKLLYWKRANIEAITSIYLLFNPYHFSEIAPALRYTLKWIYEFVLLQDENHFLFRQCASAIIALLSVQYANHLFSDQLALCFSKWFSLAAKYGNLEVTTIFLSPFPSLSIYLSAAVFSSARLAFFFQFSYFSYLSMIF